MEINEAKRIVEKANKTLKAVYAVPFKENYIFEMVDKTSGRPVYVNGAYAVNKETGEPTFLTSDYDFTGFNEARAKDAVYFSEQGMKMATVRTL